MRVVLDEANFRELVAGKTTKANNTYDCEIALADIGWDRMLDALSDAMRDRGIAIEVLIRTRRPVIVDRDDDD